MEFVVVVIIVIVITVARWPIAARRRPRYGVVACAVRVRSGYQLELSNRWSHGYLIARTGELDWRPKGLLALSRQFGESVRIAATDISRESGTVGLRQAWRLNPLLKTSLITTPTARLEVAASSAGLTALRVHLASRG